MEDWFKPNGLPSINKEFPYLLTIICIQPLRLTWDNDYIF